MPTFIRHASEHSYLDPSCGDRFDFPSLSDPPSLYLSVIIPAKDEEERMPVMLDECIPYLTERSRQDPSFTWEVIIVDDGSTDQTTEVGLRYCREFSADKVRVLTLEHNRGKGGAVRLGILSSRGRFVLFADADGATKFADFCSLENELLPLVEASEPEALVVGSRAHLQEESVAQRSLFRTILMYGFHMLVWLFCVRSIKDTQCGFKLFTRPAARFLFNNLHIERWAFDVELLFLAERRKMQMKEVAVNWKEIDGSKIVPGLASLQMGRDLLMVWFRYTTGIWNVKDVKND